MLSRVAALAFVCIRLPRAELLESGDVSEVPWFEGKVVSTRIEKKKIHFWSSGEEHVRGRKRKSKGTS